MRKGVVVVYSEDVSAGLIQTEDLEPHYFSIRQWMAKDVKPCENMNVTFEKSNSGVRDVKLID